MSAYDDYLNGLEQEDTKRNRLTSSLGEAASVNPDEFASMVKLSRAASVSLEVLPHYKEEAQQAKLFGEVGLEKLWKDAPKTSEFLSHPDHAKMASDDTANLSGIERSFMDYGRDALVTAGKGAVGLPGAAVGLADVFAGGRVGKTLDSAGFRFNETQKILDTLYSPAQQAANSRVRSADGFVNTLQAAFSNPSVIATTVGESLPQMLGGVGVSRGLLQIFPKLAPLFAGALGEGAIGAGSAAGQIRGETSDGLLTIKQQASAMASGAITAALGVAGGKAAQRMGIDDIDTALARGSAAPIDKKALLPKLAAAGFSEGVLEELPQSMQEQIWQNVALDKPLLEGVGNAGALGMLAGMVTGGAFSGLQHVTEKTNAQALDAERGAAFIETLNKFIGASTTLQRDPETFEKFITQATENGPVENIYINAQTLQQSGIAEQLAQVSPAIAEQFQAALETGGDIRIPIAEALTKIAPTEYAQSLVDHIRVDENQFSRIEAQEYMQTQGAELQGHIERIMAENEGDATFKASVDAVKENIRSQLDTANRFPSQNNEAFSTLTATFFAVTAARVGMTPEALYAKYPLRVVAESIAGGQKFDQVGKLVTDTPAFKNWFGESKVVDESGKPIVVYHGTTADFNAFQGNQRGVYFVSPSKTWVEKFYTNADGTIADGANVMPVYVKASNPFDFENKAHVKQLSYAASLSGAAVSQIKQGQWSKLEDRTTLAAIKSLGFDGLYVREDGHKNLAVFDPTQIKSATGNRGTFDPNDPNILNQSGKISGMADKDTVAGTQAPTSAGDGSTGSAFGYAGAKEAISKARKEQDRLNAYDLDAEIKSVSENGEADISSISGPEFWDSENEEFTEAGFKEVDRLIEEKARDNLRLPELNELSDLDYAHQLAQYEAMKTLFDAAGVEYNDTSSRSSKYLEVLGHKIRFADHANQVRDSAVRGQFPVFNIAPGEYSFSEAIAAVKQWIYDTPTPNSSATRLPGSPESGMQERPKAEPTQSKSGAGSNVNISQTNWNEPSASAGSDVLNQFAGQSAATADTHALATAQQRLKAGDDADVVRKETGWFIGVDGKWRYEIDDSGATLKKPYPENGALWVDVWKSRLMSGDSSTVGKMLDHPALFSAYPALADIAVSAKQGSGASYSARSRQIDIGEDVPMYEVISVLLHEIQHGIQTIEGFATGGNEKTAMLAKLSSSQRLSVALNTVDKIAEKYGYKISENQKSAIAEQVALWEDSDDSVVAKIQGDAGLNDDEIANFFTQDTHEIYRRLAGEVEARNVQSRQALTGEQRRNQSPESTQDVANSDVILVFYGKEMASAPALANASTVKARGNFNPATLQMSLLKSADLSTFLHESGHFFLEVQFDLAAQLQQDANIHGADTLKEGEQEYLRDTQAVLDWFGIKDLAEWNNLDFEEKRSYHERYAESFESYLFTGKAPSIELAPLFQKFRAFLTSVYTSLKNFLAGHPEAGKLTDEVRGVFDRMLATNEQILLAEQARSMMPIFGANDGTITPEEYANLQALGIAGTNEAIQELQAKGLRDLQWARNAKSRELRRLQSESKGVREELTMQARREIMSHPVYQAWSFLTKNRKPRDPEARAKSDPDTVDETQDSLFAAIAKLGGINKRELVETWGIDPADKAQSGVLGKFVMRAEDKGMSIDGMVESLSQYGYLQLDENGKADMRELEEKFKAELGGDTQYSNAYDYSADLEASPIINPKALGAGRLSLAGLSEMDLPPEMINHLKALRMTAKDGLHPDMVAEVVGDFGSGDEMVRAIVAAKPPKEAIAERAQELMLQNHGELATPEAIDLAADKAIHNEVRARAVEAELNALAKAIGQREATGNLDKNGKPITRPVLATAAREFAAQMIGRLKVRDIKPSQYANSEAKAARAADKAKKAGDVAQAMAEKRNQLINLYLTKAAYGAQEEVEVLRRKWSELGNRSDDKLKKTYDMDLLNAVRVILGDYGIAEKKAERAGDYLKVLERNDPEMFAIVSASVNAASDNAKPFKEMTVDEIRALNEEIGAILHLAKRSRQMEVDGDMIDRQEVEDLLNARMEEIGVPGTMPGESQAITAGEMAMLGFRTALGAMTRVESWAGRMDGSQSIGPFRRYVFGRIKSAADAYRADKSKYFKQFRDLFAAIAPSLKPSIIAAPELGYTFGKDAGGSAVNEILHAILHTGNESNKRKLLLGRNWAKENPDGSIDSSRWDAFIQRMANEGKITKSHFNFAQGMWDLLDSMKPLAQKTHRDVFGKYFDEVTAQPLASPFGTYAGGYVPAMTDARIVADSNMRALAEAENTSMAFAFPTTAKGFTKSRTEYNKPLMLDLRTLSQHIDKVLMFSHMEMPVRDVQRIIKAVGETLNKVEPAAVASILTPWLNRAAKQQVVTPITADAGMSRFLSVLRSRAGAAAMFGNLANAVQQITGFSMAALKVKPSLMVSALVDYVKHPKAFAASVADASIYMAERMNSEVAAMNDDINQILLNPSLLEKGQAWTMKHAYFLQTAIDSAMSPIVWTAAYNQAIEQGMEHADAVRLGDSAVRETQGSTLPEDISRIEGGNAFVRLFTQFAGYFNMQANLLGTEFSKVAQDYGLRKGAGKGLYVLLLGFYVPAVVGELVMQAFKGGPGDDDKDGDYLDDWLAALFGWAPLRTATAMLPVAGQGINSAVNAWNGKPYDDRIASSPAISMLESAAKAPASVYRAATGDGSQQKAIRDVATLVSMTVGIPANIAARPIGYAAGVSQSRIEPTSGADMARGLITGTASPDSKR